MPNEKLSKKDEIRLLAENDLEAFIKLIHPGRVLGAVHLDLLTWWNKPDSKTHQLTLLPRDHQKSALIAYRVAWEITRNPIIRVLYVSSTATLAIKQLKFIKDILTSDRYRYYWPDMVNEEEAKREKWTESEFSVDHPSRKIEAVRDSTVFTAGLTTSITGLHCDIAVLDDVVVYENAYTEDGRDKVKRQYSLLASIEGAGAMEWVVGTRYHPNDLYYDLMNQAVEIFSEGQVISSTLLFEVFQKQVESAGDGSGQYIWPRQQRSDGRWFGFDEQVLAVKRAQYVDRTQYRAQYYNDPNDPDENVINRDHFIYYDPKFLTRYDGRWYFKDKRLNLTAAIDFAFSLSKRSDYTAIVIIGTDSDNNTYILEIERFKTNKISDYFERILKLHQKWDYRKLRAEVTAGQSVIVKDLKDNYIRKHGLSIVIDDYRPGRFQGAKEERVEAILQPRYNNRQIFHYRGGNCQVLEEELISKHPPHDDVKDCLAACIDASVPPSGAGRSFGWKQREMLGKLSNTRFGGLGV